jgi:cation:H+ antiporter
MEQAITTFLTNQSLFILGLVIVVCIVVLVKGADLLVEEAVSLSMKWGISKMIIGATIVSLGTTLPEAAVSVLAAMTGKPGLALGNAVGSIICDTGLILGITALISPLPLVKSILRRHGWIQLGAGFLLVLSCLPYSNLPAMFTTGGSLPQFMGFAFLVLLVLYIWKSIQWSKADPAGDELLHPEVHVDSSKTTIVVLKLVGGLAMVLIGSRLLIPTVTVTATRLMIPDYIIAATMVAFGTSLPELATAVTAARKKHGELALGNIIGADILNVLFVAGASAAVTPSGLEAPPHFFILLFPAMLLILVTFRVGVFFSRETLGRAFGVILLVFYVAVTLLGFTMGQAIH